MKIKSNTICFVSEIGHNGFIYPRFNEYGRTLITEDIEDIQTKSWVCSHNNLKAIVVEASKIKDLYGAVGQKTVVWVDVGDIKE